MINSIPKANHEILSQLRIHFLNNTKQISSTLPDLSIDISELDVKEEYDKLDLSNSSFSPTRGTTWHNPPPFKN